MRGPDLPLALETGGNAPLFVRISQAVARDIGRGRLRPGQALPGSRTLALTLGVHRSTVIAAYAELAAQGWVTTKPAGATIVAAAAPDERPRRDPSAPSKRVGLARARRVPAGPSVDRRGGGAGPAASARRALPLGRRARSPSRPRRAARPRLPAGGQASGRPAVRLQR